MTLNMTIPKTQNPGGAGLFNPTGGRGGGGKGSPHCSTYVRYYGRQLTETPWFVGRLLNCDRKCG